MNLFEKILKQPKPKRVDRVEFNGYNPTFTAWTGDAYANDTYREAVDAIARNTAKLKASHVLTFSDHSRAEGKCNINRLLQVAPNEFMNAYDMLYKLTTHYFLYNNAFAILNRDGSGSVRGIYPVRVSQADFLADPSGRLFVKFIFPNGKSYIINYNDVIHLRRHYNNNDLLGDNNEAIIPALEVAHTQNEGIVNGIKSGVSLRGILHFTQILSPEKLKQQKDDFMRDYLTLENSGGVVATDEKTSYTPIENKPVTIDATQIEATQRKIYNYLGVTEKIVNSSYTDEEWAAFYESTIEPLALQMGLEFTRKIFSERERAFGNSIIFESGRLQFISNQNKINLLKEIMPMGLLTVNQALEVLNLPSVPDGDRRIQSLNYVDQAHATEYQLAQAGTTAGADPGEEGKE